MRVNHTIQQGLRLALLVMTLHLTACYQLTFKSQDMRNIRDQFHLPPQVELSAFDSNPKTAGWFGREGLTIWAVARFDERQFSEYVRDLDRRAPWQPVSFIDYSPDLADEYSESAFRWRDLPATTVVLNQGRNWALQAPAFATNKGKYFCSAIVAEPRERSKTNSVGSAWKNVGKSCDELRATQSATILSLGVLDYDKRLLYALIRFSG